MITIQNSNGNEHKFVKTVFPDGTSQAWQINPVPEKGLFTVTWMFENETELVTVLQLGALLAELTKLPPTLNVPFLPYGRQDKSITNDTTFAKSVFLEILRPYYGQIKTYDSHSHSYYVQSEQPIKLIERSALECDFVVFPDRGASDRYRDLLTELTGDGINAIGSISCEKVRNQFTGEIEGLKFIDVDFKVNLTGKKVLVLDDLCDGGKTFIEVAKLCQSVGATDLSLAISHGLFTKGIDILFDSGYNHIYTTNSLLKNNFIEQNFYSREYSKDKDLTVVEVV